jgi:pyridoxine 5-phosphate synthase
MEALRCPRLGVNVDHVATLRNARGGAFPDPVRAALFAIEAGADGITAHLREDRRHIRDEDMTRLKREISKPLNFEMAATDDMVAIALDTRPHACCLVPEKRSERTTEGGLDVVGGHDHLKIVTAELLKAGVRVSLFIEPSFEAVRASRAIGAPVIEFHTGAWCDTNLRASRRRRRLRAARDSNVTPGTASTSPQPGSSPACPKSSSSISVIF